MTGLTLSPFLLKLSENGFSGNNGDLWRPVPFLVITGLTAAFFAGIAAARFGGNKKKTTLGFLGIASVVTIALLCRFGCVAETVKGCVLCLILLFASYEDIQKRECDDFLHLMILIAAFIGTSFAELPNMAFSAIFAGGLILLAALMTKADIGGADVKMAAACSFRC